MYRALPLPPLTSSPGTHGACGVHVEGSVLNTAAPERRSVDPPKHALLYLALVAHRAGQPPRVGGRLPCWREPRAGARRRAKGIRVDRLREGRAPARLDPLAGAGPRQRSPSPARLRDACFDLFLRRKRRCPARAARPASVARDKQHRCQRGLGSGRSAVALRFDCASGPRWLNDLPRPGRRPWTVEWGGARSHGDLARSAKHEVGGSMDVVVEGGNVLVGSLRVLASVDASAKF